MTCEILVPWPGIEPRPSAVKVRSPNHWTARKVPTGSLFKKLEIPTSSSPDPAALLSCSVQSNSHEPLHPQVWHHPGPAPESHQGSQVCVRRQCWQFSAGNVVLGHTDRTGYWQPVARSSPPRGHVGLLSSCWGRVKLRKTHLVLIPMMPLLHLIHHYGSPSWALFCM